MEIPTKEIFKLVKYLKDDEEKHWEECGKPEDHIYNTVCIVETWLSLINN